MATKAKDVPTRLVPPPRGASARSSATSTKSANMPNLIEVQRESYEQFLRSDPATGYVSGLEKTLRSVFPIQDFAGTAHLDFDHYVLEDPKYDTDECRQRGLTYAAPMRVTLRLTTLRNRSRHRGQVGHRYQGAGRLHGRHAADDGQRHLHHQRHRARHRSARCTARRASCSTMTAARPTRRASISSPRASFRIAAPGSTSSSTPRTSSTSASTASASCR